MFVVGRSQGLLAAAEAGVRAEDGAECQDGRRDQEEKEEDMNWSGICTLRIDLCPT